MTSQKQTDANRRNALLSSGPRTEEGKQSSRRNAFTHGLTAETVIVGVEDVADYNAFETEIVTEYDPKSVIERELTRRLASLLWRLRRVSLIETGLLHLHCESRNDESETMGKVNGCGIAFVRQRVPRSPQIDHCDKPHEDPSVHNCNSRDNIDYSYNDLHADPHRNKQQAITRSFLRLAELSSQPLERVNRYEVSLWRQFVQVLYSLDQAKYHRLAAARHRFTPHSPQW